jgi:putative transposase
MVLVKPAAVIQWHRQGFRRYWRWRSGSQRPGRPGVNREIRDLIRQMSVANPLWGAPRIHGEMLKLGIEVSQATVGRHMARRHGPPSPTWRTFLSNQIDGIASIDTFVVVAAAFRLLYVSVILGHARRKILHLNVTEHPTAGWLSRQITEAFPWNTAPRCLLRDRDGSYGQCFRERARAMGITEAVRAPRSPWQNAYVERVIGSIRRECLDHVVVINERHLRRVLISYADYYHHSRTHLSLDKDCPDARPIQPPNRGRVIAISPSRRPSPALRTPRCLIRFRGLLHLRRSCIVWRPCHRAQKSEWQIPTTRTDQRDLIRFIAQYSPQPGISHEMEFCAATGSANWPPVEPRQPNRSRTGKASMIATYAM